MRNDGYFLIEALLSIVIFAVLILSVFSMISFLQRRTVRSNFEAEAVLLVQDAMEITHTAILSDWGGYPDGTYFPVFNADENSWILFPGEETDLETRYSRKIILKRVCRDVDGDILEDNSPCLGTVDNISRQAEVTVSWMEKEVSREIGAELLVLNTND